MRIAALLSGIAMMLAPPPAMAAVERSKDQPRKASYGNVRRLRYPEKQKAPDWVKKFFDAQVQGRLQRARKNYEETGHWFYCKYHGDCGGSVWWDEVATARVWTELQGFLGGLGKLPYYSKENHKKAVEFWQSWQNKKNGRFYNPILEDPQNPGVWRNREGYNRGQYSRKGNDRVNQKYVPGILKALGSAPLRKTSATQVVMENDSIPLKKLEGIIQGGRGQMTGNWGCRMLHLMAGGIDEGETGLIPDYERLMALLLRKFNPQTGMLSVGLKSNVNSYGVSANNVKGFARIVGYDGLENYPYRKELADALVDKVAAAGITNAGAVRNYSYLMSLSLQQSDRRQRDLFEAIGKIVEAFKSSKRWGDGYAWMTLSTASAWMNWDIAPVEAFLDPSVATSYNGVTRPNRSVIGPLGHWVNIIPKEPEEIFGHRGFSWDKYSLRARNRRHERKDIVNVVPTVAEAKSQWVWTTADPGKDSWQSKPGFDGSGWHSGNPKAKNGEEALWMRYAFDLDTVRMRAPYIKAKWSGDFEIYLNGVMVQKVSGDFSEYCGFHVPKAARKTLRKGRNVIAVKAIKPNGKTMIDAGLIDWREG